MRKNLFSREGFASNVPSKSKSAATLPLFSFTSFTSCTSSTSLASVTSPPAQLSSRAELVQRPKQNAILRPTPATHAANKTPPSSRSAYERQHEPARANRRSFLPATPQAHESTPAPVPGSKSRGIS